MSDLSGAGQFFGQFLFPHVIARIGDALQLPVADFLVPVHVAFDHLLHREANCTLRPYLTNLSAYADIAEQWAHLIVGRNEVVDDEHLQAQFATQLSDTVQQSFHFALMLRLQVVHLELHSRLSRSPFLRLPIPSLTHLRFSTHQHRPNLLQLFRLPGSLFLQRRVLLFDVQAFSLH